MFAELLLSAYYLIVHFIFQVFKQKKIEFDGNMTDGKLGPLYRTCLVFRTAVCYMYEYVLWKNGGPANKVVPELGTRNFPETYRRTSQPVIAGSRFLASLIYFSLSFAHTCSSPPY